MYIVLAKYIQNQNIVLPNVVIGLIANAVNALLHYILLYELGMSTEYVLLGGVSGDTASLFVPQEHTAPHEHRVSPDHSKCETSHTGRGPRTLHTPFCATAGGAYITLGPGCRQGTNRDLNPLVLEANLDNQKHSPEGERVVL